MSKHKIIAGLRGNGAKKTKAVPPPSGLEDFLMQSDVWHSTLLPLLDPIDLIRLMHTSKSSRRVAAAALNELEAGSSIQTQAHTHMFRGFLRRPRVTKCNDVLTKELANEKAAIPGPLRLRAIADCASEVEKRFAILRYEKSYDKEESLVIMFDGEGAFVGHYVFSSDIFYEDYVTKNIMCGGGGHHGVFNSRGGTNTSMPEIQLHSSGRFGYGDTNADDHKWQGPVQAQTDYYWQEGWLGCVVDPHYALIDSFAGLLSPTEAMFVLMHALSSDTRVIYVMTASFFDDLEHNLSNYLEGMDDDEEEWENLQEQLTGFRQKLMQFSYTNEDQG